MRDLRRLLEALLHPRRSLASGDRPTGVELFRRWLLLLAIAVGGSVLYGASLSLLTKANPIRGALWIAISAGASWCLLIPALSRVTKRPPSLCFTACLMTMACGEFVLVLGSLGNFAVWLVAGKVDPVFLNAGIVAVSNIVMAGMLASQLQALGARVIVVLITFFLVLDGAGAFFFWATWQLRALI